MTATAHAATRRLVYNRAIGLTTIRIRGFYYPWSCALREDGWLYVLRRCHDVDARGVHVTLVDPDDEYIDTYGSWGEGDGQFIWPVSIVMDRDQRLFISDEHLHRVTIMSTDGEFMSKWGEIGSGDGELDGPSGLAFDSNNELLVVDSRNSRVQRFTVDGEFLHAFGTAGSDPGQFNLPWGVGVDRGDNIYVADWGNDRIQKFTAEGEFVATYGASGRGHGEIRRPAGVCVDDDGYIYVADWGNHRVQVFDPAGHIVQSVRGEATLSKWAEEFLNANPLDRAAREESDLEPDLDFFDEHDESAHVEKYFWAPSWVSIHDGRLYVVDSNRHRLQLYDLAAAP